MSKSEKSAYFRHVFANNFFRYIFLTNFSADLKTAWNSAFFDTFLYFFQIFDTHIEFLIKNFFFALISMFS